MYERLLKIIEVTKSKNVSRLILESSNKEIIETDVHNLFQTNNDVRLKLNVEYEDNHDYVMLGKVYNKNSKETYISYGGLLMKVPENLEISLDTNIYCFIDYLT